MYHVCTAHPLCTTLPRRTADLMLTGRHSSCTNPTTSSRLDNGCGCLPPIPPAMYGSGTSLCPIMCCLSIGIFSCLWIDTVTYSSKRMMRKMVL
jgi:hypothetical protein